MTAPTRRLFPRNLGPCLLRRHASSRPYTAERSPASKSASAKSQAKKPPTGFAAIASYNVINRRWLGIMVGTPVVVVTSYVLYQRVFNGKEPRPFDKSLKGKVLGQVVREIDPK